MAATNPTTDPTYGTDPTTNPAVTVTGTGYTATGTNSGNSPNPAGSTSTGIISSAVGAPAPAPVYNFGMYEHDMGLDKPYTVTDGYKAVNFNGQSVEGMTQQKLQDLQTSAQMSAGTTNSNPTLAAFNYDKNENPGNYLARWNPDGTPKFATDGTSQPYVASPNGVTVGAPAPAPAGGGSAPAPGTGSNGMPAVTNWNVTPQQTVQDRLRQILDPNSALMQQATAQSNDAMNARGLVNSSLAQSAATDAMLKTALPIAQQDAGTFSKAAETNAGAANTSSLTGAQLANQRGIAQLQADTSIKTTGMNNQTALAQTTLSTESQRAIAQMSNDTQIKVNNDLNANRVLLQNSQAATNLANQFALNVGNIDANDKMDAAAKQEAIQQQRTIFNDSIAALTKATPGIPDVSTTLKFTNEAGGPPAPAPAPAPGIVKGAIDSPNTQ